ncbi:hypothetical protein UFOVP699_24 [uncultured Caudovirales phage]|uniref:Uncharacterized protein n=1 Tax=uncultured Caudovirales phage TaxID=2100421 RepID=A0A6J5NI66_9CAUD|nr:hypothetical protein UFOVP699_24 [uncultured Caudovirales phage]
MISSNKVGPLERIALWWRFDGRYMHKEFARGIKNLWRWFPTIWKDRDWDDQFIFEIIRVKLENQAKHIGSRGLHTTAKRDAEIMRLVAKLIKLQQDDFYSMEYMDYHDTKYDFVPTDETKKWYEMQDTLLSERFDEYFAKYPIQYKKVISCDINRFRRSEDPIENKKLIAMEIAHENHERCRTLIFKIMNNHIERWWD